jgi:sirohydrochlorin cobaltochelatase
VKNLKTAVILIGHGGLPSDIPSEIVENFMRLHKVRIKTGSKITKEEIELDRAIRLWKRTPENDPYKAGLESLASEMENYLDGFHIKTAYNEFCHPDIEDAVDELVKDNYSKFILVTTMITRGGSHSEKEIPEELNSLREKHPTIDIQYAWPFCMKNFAEFLAKHVQYFNKDVSLKY